MVQGWQTMLFMLVSLRKTKGVAMESASIINTNLNTKVNGLMINLMVEEN